MVDGKRDANTAFNKKTKAETVGFHQSHLLGVSVLPFSVNNMYRGYIKMWRKAKDWAFSDCPLALALWIHLLWEANHKPTRKIFKGEVITINPGELLTGRKYLSKISGVSESIIEKYLKWFEKEGQIKQQTSTKNRLITILNWELYQNTAQQPIQQKDNKKTTKRQQKDTPKNDKNDKNDKNIKKERGIPSLQALKDYFLKTESSVIEAEKFYDYFSSNGWKVGGKAPMKDWQAAARNWVRRNKPAAKKTGVDKWYEERKKMEVKDDTRGILPTNPSNG